MLFQFLMEFTKKTRQIYLWNIFLDFLTPLGFLGAYYGAQGKSYLYGWMFDQVLKCWRWTQHFPESTQGFLSSLIRDTRPDLSWLCGNWKNHFRALLKFARSTRSDRNSLFKIQSIWAVCVQNGAYALQSAKFRRASLLHSHPTLFRNIHNIQLSVFVLCFEQF